MCVTMLAVDIQHESEPAAEVKLSAQTAGANDVCSVSRSSYAVMVMKLVHMLQAAAPCCCEGAEGAAA